MVIRRLLLLKVRQNWHDFGLRPFSLFLLSEEGFLDLDGVIVVFKVDSLSLDGLAKGFPCDHDHVSWELFDAYKCL